MAGNFTPMVNDKPVTGILAKSKFGGEDIDLVGFFTGDKGKTANIGGKATGGINFFDSGGLDVLKMGGDAADPTSRQFKLMQHLYGVFGSLTGCSMMGQPEFPFYAGNPSMTVSCTISEILNHFNPSNTNLTFSIGCA